MNTPLPGPLSGLPATRAPLAAEPVAASAPAAAAPAAPPSEVPAGVALPADEGVVLRATLDGAESELDLERVELRAEAMGEHATLPPVVAAVLTEAVQRGKPLPFDAASLAAEAKADAAQRPAVPPRRAKPPQQTGNVLGRRNALVTHLQRNAVMLVRAAMTLGELRTALHKATMERASPGTLRQLTASIERMETLCAQLEHAIGADGQSLARLDADTEVGG